MKPALYQLSYPGVKWNRRDSNPHNYDANVAVFPLDNGPSRANMRAKSRLFQTSAPGLDVGYAPFART